MPDWNSLFNEKENRWENPYEDVISLVSSNLIPMNSLILDLGCSAGRHLKYLGSKGHRVAGMDFSVNGLQFALQTLTTEKLPNRLMQADMSTPLPFPENCFDCVISIHVIFHNPRRLLQHTIDEIFRILKPGAILLVTFNSTYSFRCGKGIELEKDTWIPDIGIDKGIPHHFSTLNDVSDLLRMFKVLTLRLDENTSDGNLSAHWVVTAQKPS